MKKTICSFFIILFFTTTLYGTEIKKNVVIAEKNVDVNLMISPDDIQTKIKQVAVNLNEEYKDKPLVILSILKGSICLCADLIRELKCDYTLEFIRCISYNGDKRENLTISGVEAIYIKDKNILVIDDIFDSGVTLSTVVEKLKLKTPKSIQTLVLLNKVSKNIVDYKPTYSLFEIEDEFVIGYGLDYDQKYRGLKGVFAVPATR
jgi:hypoxanthine phosphoribosyltransferase